MKKSMQGNNENEKRKQSKQSAKNANADFKYKRILQLYSSL